MKFLVIPKRIIEKGMFVIGDDGQPRDLPPHVVISITTPGDPDAKIERPESLKGILRLKFWDIVNKDLYENNPDLEISAEDLEKYKRDIFDEGDAKAICNFVRKHLDSVELIICHCDAGISRSAGTAAALSKMIEGNDEQFYKPPYRPNALVYRTIINVWQATQP